MRRWLWVRMTLHSACMFSVVTKPTKHNAPFKTT